MKDDLGDKTESLLRKYSVRKAQFGGMVIDVVEGPQLVLSLLDRDYFETGWFAKEELEVLSELEKIAQGVFAQAPPRLHSGMPAYYHMDLNLEEAFRIAKVTDTKLDFLTVLVIIGHDIIEDHPDVRSLTDEWKNAMEKDDEILYTSLGNELSELRIKLHDELNLNLKTYVKFNVESNLPIYAYLMNDIDKATRIIYDVTRFKEILPFHESMERQYRLDLDENPRVMLVRSLAKNVDRISNSRETGPFYVREVMEWAASAFEDPSSFEGVVIGEELTQRLGGIRLDYKDMSPAYKVMNAFNGLTQLQYLNIQINGCIEQIGKGGGPSISSLMGSVLYSRSVMIESLCKLLDSAISEYEMDDGIKEHVPEMDELTGIRRQTNYFQTITEGGPISRLLIADVAGRRVIDSSDKTVEGMEANYAAARELREAIPLFGGYYEGALVRDGIPLSLHPGDPTSRPFDPERDAYFTLNDPYNVLESINGRNFVKIVGDEMRKARKLEKSAS